MAIDHYSTATAMLAALRRHEISSTELVEMHIARIEAHDGTLNAIPVRTFERVRQEAQRADARLAAGDTAPLLGLPMTLKESTLTAGLPQSAGMRHFKDYRPTIDGPVADRVFRAGACLLGKTNIPVALGDWQANSPVYGRTNNPWDVSRTPGGSTGGGGAALAAGMTPLEVGSDIGGSIRVPAAYCGVYGHRPSETAIPKSGLFPQVDLPNPARLMGVQGPLARSALDLELLFDVLVG
ncbi:MAG TPA: amidase family protein, partial [Candidatus Tectomicrobia bacterium]